MTSRPTIPLAATGEDGRHLYTCPLCEAMCGLEIQVADGKVASIRGNRDDAWSRGHICPKGATLGALHEDPDRIRRPMVKVDGKWHEVTWDAADGPIRHTVSSLGAVELEDELPLPELDPELQPAIASAAAAHIGLPPNVLP